MKTWLAVPALVLALAGCMRKDTQAGAPRVEAGPPEALLLAAAWDPATRTGVDRAFLSIEPLDGPPDTILWIRRWNEAAFRPWQVSLFESYVDLRVPAGVTYRLRVKRRWNDWRYTERVVGPLAEGEYGKFSIALPRELRLPPVRRAPDVFEPGTIVGRLVTSEGQPLAGIPVSLERWGGGLVVVIPKRETDADGWVEFPDVPPGAYGARAHRGPFHQELGRVPMYVASGGGVGVTWTVGLHGRLVDSGGRPVPLARLELSLPRRGERRPFAREVAPELREQWEAWRSSAEWMPHAAWTDEDGRFLFAEVQPGAWELVAEAPESAAVEVLDASSERAGVLPMMFELPRPEPLTLLAYTSSVKGRVVDPSGAPSPTEGLKVTSLAGQDLVPVRLSPDGSFEIGPLVPGDVAVVAEGYGPFAGSARAVFRDGAHDVEMRLRVPGEIEGTVLDETGAPANAYMRYRADDGSGYYRLGFAPADGQFSQPRVEPGPWVVTAETPEGRFGFARILVEPGETSEVEVRLAPGADLRIDEREGMRLRLASAGVVVREEPLYALTILRIPAGTLTISLLGDGEVLRREADVAPGEVLDLTGWGR